MSDYIDLHVHTTASDGTLSPAEVVRLAAKQKLRAISITDHDAIDGISDAVAEGKKLGVEVITGVELSIDYQLPNNGDMHLLGFFIDPASTSLCASLDWLRQEREMRIPKVLAILEKHKINISLFEVKAIAKDATLGRPHIARAMINKGYASSIQEAFDKYLKKGAVAYVKRKKFELQQAVNLILDAGGCPILAHPYTLNLPHPKLEDLLVTMKDMGLKGMEAYHSDHSSQQMTEYLEMATKLNLCVSGGTDFHGNNKPDIKLGTGHGNLKIPYSVVEELRQK